MSKENATKDVVVRVQPTLFVQFQAKCKTKYKTVSEVVRELMVRYITESK